MGNTFVRPSSEAWQRQCRQYDRHQCHTLGRSSSSAITTSVFSQARMFPARGWRRRMRRQEMEGNFHQQVRKGVRLARLSCTRFSIRSKQVHRCIDTPQRCSSDGTNSSRCWIPPSLFLISMHRHHRDFTAHNGRVMDCMELMHHWARRHLMTCTPPCMRMMLCRREQAFQSQLTYRPPWLPSSLWNARHP